MISICIVTYKNPSFTALCIDSLNKTTYKDKEIIVWDNSENNLGFAKACNILAKRSKGDYLFFLNNDTLVKEDIFERLLESDYDVVGCRRFNYIKMKELISGFSVDKFGFPSDSTGPVFYPDGAMFMSKELFISLGGFDEASFLYGEDRDFCWRAWLAGYSVGMSEATFYHSSHSVMGRVNYNRRYHSEKNTIRYMLKNYTRRSLWRILPQYLILALLELSYLIVRGKGGLIIKSYLPAYWWNLINLKDTLKERKKVIHNIPDEDLPLSKIIGKVFTLKNGLLKWG